MKNKESIFKEFTNKYALSKTLRFELVPEGKTLENMKKSLGYEEGTENKFSTFLKDQNIEDAYQVLKPVFDKIHEDFITKSLESNDAKNLDFSEYFETYLAYKNEQNKDQKFKIEKELENNVEKKIRLKFSSLYDKEGEEFKKHVGKDEKGKEILKEKSFKVLTEAGILKYVKNNIDYFASLELQTVDGKKVTKKNLEIALVKNENENKGVLEGFFTYFSGFNQNRENYYSTDEKSTAVATRVVNQNLPKFCDNATLFEFRKSEYVKIDEFLKEKGISLISKQQNGGETELHKINKDYFEINFFSRCLSQKEIENYNLEIGNANNLINRHNNQQQDDRSKKLKLFKTLYKQIGCGEKGEFIQKIKNDNELKEKVQEVKNNTISYFEKVNDFIYYLNDHDFQDVFWSDKAINTISSKYLSDWSTLKKEIWGKRDRKGNLKDEETKIPKAIALKELFEELNNVTDWNLEGKLFKASIFESGNKTKKLKAENINEFNKNKLDNELTIKKLEIIETSDTPSRALLEMIFADINFLENKFDTLSSAVLEISDFSKDENKQNIKNWLDSILFINQIIKYWKVKDSFGAEGTLDEKLKEILYSENNPTRYYDIVRNYLTRKRQGELNKLKLNFENSTLAQGWDLNKEKDNFCIILQDENLNQYLAILQNKYKDIFEQKENNDMYNSDNMNWKKMVYKYFPDASKMIPKCSTQLKKVKNHFENSSENFILPKGYKVTSGDKFVGDLIITKEVWELNNRVFNKDNINLSKIKNKDDDEDKDYIKSFQKEFSEKDLIKYKDSLIKWIDFCKDFLKVYPPTSIFNYSFKDSDKYNSIDEFYSDVDIKSYEINFVDVNKSLIDKIVDDGRLYLFKIKNKDFNLDKNKEKISNKNLHTIYWQSIFKNIENKPKLNGEAEIFYRPALKEDKLQYVKKKDKDGQETDDFLLDKKGERVIKNYRFSKEKFLFHCPITLNFGAKSPKLNDEINSKIKDKKELYFLGIDRGEKHLAYYSLINQKGEILKQGSFNKINGQNYAKKLEEKAGNRDNARKNWQTIGTIKELKDGYISQVVRKIVDLAIENNALIVLENLNIGFKRGRQKIEKQVYQKLELALAKKLNFLVDKKANEGEVCFVTNALQLTPPVNNFGDIEGRSQFGIMLYTKADYTSQTDPVTGWRKSIYLKKGSEEYIKEQIITLFDDFGFDGNDYYFTYKDKNTGKNWTLYSSKNGKSLDRYYRELQYENSEKKWTPKKQDLIERLDKIFSNFDFSKNKSAKNQILDGDEIKLEKYRKEDQNAWESLRFTIDLIQQIRNTGTSERDEDFILSPVRNNDGNHFDSRIYLDKEKSNEEMISLPVSGDANGAYNIARKGIVMNEHIKENLNLFIKDEEWDSWLAGEDAWKNWLEKNQKGLKKK